MLNMLKEPLHRMLRWSEKHTKTDMVHFFASNVWLNVSRFISVGIGMLLTVAFANLLTPEAFGTYKYVIASAGFVATFSLSGLLPSLMRAVAQNKKNVIPAIVHTAMFWSIPASIAALGVSVYYFGHANSELGFAFLFIAVTNAVSNGIGVTKGVWQAVGDFRMATLSGIPKIVVPPIIVLITILVTQNVVWILLAYFASNLIMSWAGYRFILWWFTVKGSQEDVAEVVRYGKQMSLLGFFQLASGQIDQLLLWHFTTPATLVIYALALAPVNEARNLLTNFFAIAFPKIANRTKEEIHTMIPLRLRQLLAVSIIVVVVYVLLVPFLFTYLFPKYLAAVVVSQVLAVVILLQPRGIIDTYFVTHGEIKKRSTAILVSQAVKFGLFIVLIPLFGLWGAVAATVLSEVFVTFIYFIIYMLDRKNLNRL